MFPKLYGLPKIHKKEVSLRPIVSSSGSITYEAAKYLTEVICPLVGKTEHHVKNSLDFVQKFRGFEVSPSRKLVSFDVSALLTSTPQRNNKLVNRRRTGNYPRFLDSWMFKIPPRPNTTRYKSNTSAPARFDHRGPATKKCTKSVLQVQSCIFLLIGKKVCCTC